MKIAFSTLACPKWNMDQIVDAAREYGYHGVELRGYMGEMYLPGLPEFTTGLDNTLRLFSRAGVEISALGSSARLLNAAGKDTESLAEVAAYAKLCREMGVPMIRVFGGAFEGRPRSQSLQIGAENLAKAAQLALPITIALETHDDWSDTSLVAEAVRLVKAPNVRVLWDVHHPFRALGESPAKSFANIGKLTAYVHVKDSRVSSEGKLTYTLPGEGDVPLTEMIDLLRQGGYDGYLTAEWEQFWHKELAGPEISLPAHAAFLKRLVRRSAAASSPGVYLGTPPIYSERQT